MTDTSFGERVWIVQGVEQDLRTDGRSRLNFRPLGVEANIIAQADGSARLHLGATDVLVGVKVSGLGQAAQRPGGRTNRECAVTPAAAAAAAAAMAAGDGWQQCRQAKLQLAYPLTQCCLLCTHMRVW